MEGADTDENQELSPLRWLLSNAEAEQAAQTVMDDIVRGASEILYDNYLKRREVPFASARAVENLFSAIERQMLTHDGEPGSADASYLDGKNVAGVGRGPRLCSVFGVSAPVLEHALPGIPSTASFAEAALPSSTGSWVAEAEPAPCAIDSWARAAMPQVHRRRLAQAAAKEAQRQVVEGSYDGTGRPNVRLSRLSDGRGSRRRTKSGGSKASRQSGGAKSMAGSPVASPVASPGGRRRSRRAPTGEDASAASSARNVADNRAMQQQLGLADRPASREQPSRLPGPRDSHLDTVRKEGLRAIAGAAQ